MTNESLDDQVRSAMPFAALLGVEMVSSSAHAVRASLRWAPERCTSGDALHGGALMALADVCGGLCAFNNLPDGAKGTTTIESKTNFLRGVRDGFVEAVSRPLHVGRTTIVVDTELRDVEDRLVGRVTQTQAVMR
jgi:1,4-dihydroxy-2-naphthoyl-CoA hydrolase